MIRLTVKAISRRIGNWFPDGRPSKQAMLLVGVFVAGVFIVTFASRPGPPTFEELAVSGSGGSGPIAFSPDGETLAMVTEGKTICLWNVRTGQTERILELPGELRALALSAETVAALVDDHGVVLWDRRSGERLRSLDGKVSAIAFSPGSETLATGYWGCSHDGSVRLWDARSGRLLQVIQDNGRNDRDCPPKEEGDMFMWSYSVSALAFSPDGGILASAHGGHLHVAIKLWDVRQGKLLRELYGMGAGIKALAFLSRGRSLAAALDSGKVMFWDIRREDSTGELSVGTRGVASLAISPDGKMLAACGWEGVEGGLWDLRTASRLPAFDGVAEGGGAVAFSLDGRTFAAASRQGVRLWNLARR